MYQRTVLRHFKMNDIRPNVCGRRKCTPGFTNGWKYRPNYLLSFVANGRATFSNERKTYHLKAGDLAITHPGEYSRFVADMEDPADRIWVSFVCNCDASKLLTEDVIHMPTLAPIFFRIIEGASLPTKEWVIYAQLFELFSKLAARKPNWAPSKDYVGQAVGIIETNYNQVLRVDELASGLGLSRSYFCRIFHEKTGMSPQDYIVSYRLEKAAELLENKKLTQDEISKQVGYPDVYAFSRMFKRKYGISPGKYRKNILGRRTDPKG